MTNATATPRTRAKPKPVKGPAPVKVYLFPEAKDSDVGGIGRVALAQQRGLAAHGVELVQTPGEADVIAGHITIPANWAKQFPDKAFVTHCHGLYWNEMEWPRWGLATNADVLAAVRMSDVVTAPTEWVAASLRRHTSRPVHVVHHGVDLEEWHTEEPRSAFVLWDKFRVDPVCDPTPVANAAYASPQTQFAVTAWDERVPAPANINNLGQLGFEDAKTLCKKAGIYLATTRETFGVSILQALAAGVPVVGFNWGGLAEIHARAVAELGQSVADDAIRMVPPDSPTLSNAIDLTMMELEQSGGARSAAALRVAALFDWVRPMQQYARLYRAAAETRITLPGTVGIVITSFNLRKYLPDAVESVSNLVLNPKRRVKCIIVDDGSTDGSREWLEDRLGSMAGRVEFAVRHTPNVYLAEARNTGINDPFMWDADYILPLDADDMLDPDAVERLAYYLDEDRSLHVAYGGVQFREEDGVTLTTYQGHTDTPGRSGWPVEMDPVHQLSVRNCLPYASMFRRTAWDRTGGYRPRCKTGEDADFWSRLVSYGFVARRVTQEITLIYRNRADSMSRTQGPVHYQKWFGWGGMEPQCSMPAGGNLAGEVDTVWSFDPVPISVIIPVGPGHERRVQTAIDSIEAQTFNWWECIVVWDSPEPPRMPLPRWVRLIELPEPGVGPGLARNAGVAIARGAHVLFLDADDILERHALDVFWKARQVDKNRVWFPDFFEDPETPGEFKAYQFPHWEPARLTTAGALATATAMFPIEVARKFPFRGGATWEDYAIQLDTVAGGVCWGRIGVPLFVYSKWTGARREGLAVDKPKAQEEFRRAYGGNIPTQEEIMAGCAACRQGAASTFTPMSAEAKSAQRAVAGQPGGDMVHMAYEGPFTSATYFRPNGREYVLQKGDDFWALPDDVDWFLAREGFARFMAPADVGESTLAGTVR